VALDAVLRERMAAESRRIIQNYSPEFCARGIARSALATNATFARNTDRLNLPPGQQAAALG
jgi:hypothetical protein